MSGQILTLLALQNFTAHEHKVSIDLFTVCKAVLAARSDSERLAVILKMRTGPRAILVTNSVNLNQLMLLFESDKVCNEAMVHFRFRCSLDLGKILKIFSTDRGRLSFLEYRPHLYRTKGALSAQTTFTTELGKHKFVSELRARDHGDMSELEFCTALYSARRNWDEALEVYMSLLDKKRGFDAHAVARMTAGFLPVKYWKECMVRMRIPPEVWNCYRAVSLEHFLVLGSEAHVCVEGFSKMYKKGKVVCEGNVVKFVQGDETIFKFLPPFSSIIEFTPGNGMKVRRFMDPRSQWIKTLALKARAVNQQVKEQENAANAVMNGCEHTSREPRKTRIWFV